MVQPTALILGPLPMAENVAERLRIAGVGASTVTLDELGRSTGHAVVVLEPAAIASVRAAVGPEALVLAIADGPAAESARSLGATEVLASDTDPAELGAALRALLARGASHDAPHQASATHDALLRVEDALAVDGQTPEALRSALIVAAEVMSFERVALVANPSGSERAIVVAATDDPQHQQFALRLWNYPEIRRAVQYAEPIAIADATAHPSTAAVASKIEGANVRAIIVVPVMWDGVVLGAVVFRNSSPGVGHVSSDMFGFARLFAARVAAHLRDSDIVHQLQAQLSEEYFSTDEGTDVTLPCTREFLEKLIDSVVDGVVAADNRGNVVLFNKGAERIFGATAGEVIGVRRMADLFPHGVAESIMRMLRGPEHGGEGQLAETRREVLSTRGDLVPVNMTASIIYEEGEEVATVCIFSDLRERIRIEQRLLSAQEKLEVSEKQALVAQLAGAAAHELNQPLTSIMGYAQLVARQLEADGQSSRAVDIILREAERMADIVRKIGRITSFETKDYVGSTSIIDLEKSSNPPVSFGGAIPGKDRAVTPKRPVSAVKQTAKIPWPMDSGEKDPE